MKIALFDLDGTLTDSAEGIFKCIIYALKKMNRVVPSKEILKLFIGPPIIESLQEHCSMTEEEAKEGYRIFQERYSTLGKFENAVYPEITEMLSQLKDNGVLLAVATAKPEIFARQILDHFHLSIYFSVIKGADNARGLVHKDDILREALSEINSFINQEDSFNSKKIGDKAIHYMVGDRLYDMEAANSLGCIPVGVSYGFGTEEELREAGAKVICQTTLEVSEYILT